MKKLSTFLTIIGLSYLSCSLSFFDPSINDEYFPVQPELKALGDFKEGSYWIYHNDSSNVNDTLTVKIRQTRWEGMSWDAATHYSEMITITLESSFGAETIIDELNNNFTRQYGAAITTPHVFTITYYDSIYKTFLNRDTVEYLYNFELNGKKYETVLHYSSYDPIAEYYLAPKKGIIKIVRTVDSIKQTWNLISSVVYNSK